MKIFEFKHNNQTISLHDLEGKKEEYEVLHKWLTDPEILQFYEGRDKKFTLEDIKSKYGRKLDLDFVTPCLIKLDGLPIGYLQFFEFQETGEWTPEEYALDYEQDIYAIDLFIGKTDIQNKGIGSALLKNLCEYLLNNKSVKAIYIDPRLENERAIGAYEKAGFKKIKILKEYETFEGEKRDGWLMEYESKLKIRKAKQNDITVLSKMIIENLEALVEEEGPIHDVLIPFYDEEHLSSKMERLDFYVIVDGEEIVGTVALENNQVRNTFIKNSQRRKGIGTKLINHLENIIREKGDDKLIVTSNPFAVNFYKKQGFKEIRNTTAKVGDDEIDLVYMEKSL